MKAGYLLLIFALATGCTTSGSIRGVSDGKVVNFNYEQEFMDNDGKLNITMPDGESYAGKFVQSSTSTSGDGLSFGESSDDDSLILTDSTTLSSDASALLIGNRGSTMNCTFRFSDPDSGIDGGGIGDCETSKKQKVAIAF